MICRGGRPVALPPTPFALLCALLRHPGMLLTKNQLLDQVWGHRFVSDSVLKGTISEVRSALGDDPRQPRYIETVPRRGYRFIAALSTTSDEPGAAAPAPDAPTFIGRRTELAQLHQLWLRAQSGSRIIAWIAGEPGIGKSTLIDHFVASVAPAVCVRGQCVQHHGASEPYLPLLEALAELCQLDPEAAALMRDVAPTWLLQLPWLITADQRELLIKELVGANPQQRMLREVGEFMDRYSARQPLLLITEDLHWGDSSTIQLVDYLARRRTSSRLMWLATFRLTEVIALDHPLNAVRRELKPHGLSVELILDAFSETDVAAYVAAQAPALAGDERLVRAVHERTGGVPLFVSAIATEIRALRPDGQGSAALTLAANPVPESLAARLDHDVAKLTTERRTLLNAAAVCGMALHLETLSQVTGWRPDDIAEICTQLLQEGVWLVATPTPLATQDVALPCQFRHALFRQRLYESLSPLARSELHARVGEALEQQRSSARGVTAAELATHFERGRIPLKALRYYAEAAEAALCQLSPLEAMSLTAQALALAEQLPAASERDALVISLATLRGRAAFHTLGAGDEAKAAYQRALALLDGCPHHPMAALALHGFGFLLYLRAEYSEALAVAAHADALANRQGSPLLTLVASTTQGQVQMMCGNLQAARQTLERALPALAQREHTAADAEIGFIVDPQTTVLAMLSLPLAQLGLLVQARQRLTQAYARAHQLKQPMALMVTVWFDALCAIRSNDVSRVGALAKEMQALVDEYGLAQGKAACRWFQGWTAAHCGKARDGAAQIRAAYDDNRALGMVAGGSETLGYLAQALILQGDWTGASAALQQAMTVAEQFGEGIYRPQLLILSAQCAQAHGDLAHAEALLVDAIDAARRQGSPWLELQAQLERAELDSGNGEALAAMAALVGALPEAQQTDLVQRARAQGASGAQ